MYPRSLMMQQIGFLGAGHMGGAVLNGALEAGVMHPDAVVVVDASADRRAWAESLGCHAEPSVEVLAPCDVVVLAVRPQDFPAAAAELETDHARLAISVMAGLTSETIAVAMGPNTRVVRAMPNAPASIGKAVTAVAPGVGATDEDVAGASALFQGIGRVVHVHERDMFAVTAVSGSGPAWVYHLAEAIFAEGVALGLDEETADTLVRTMIEGAAALMSMSDLSLTTLRESVVTPGGTTEAGLAAMDAAGLSEAIRIGVRAACRRGEELAG